MDSQCLQPSQNTISNGYGMNHKDLNFVVGSVRLGCDTAALQNTIQAEHDAHEVVVVSKRLITA